MVDRIAPPPPGIYPGIPMAEYHLWDAVRSKWLMILYTDCPAVLKAEMDSPSPSSPQQVVGRGFHTLLLEPDRFKQRFAVGGPVNPKTEKAYGRSSQKWAEWAAGQDGKDILSAGEHDQIIAMADSLRNHPEGPALLEGRGRNEVSIVWIDPDTGLLCKARVDRWCEWHGYSVHMDAKSAADASRNGFFRAIIRCGYHLQAAHYLEGAAHAPINGQRATDALRRFLFAAVGKTYPYPVGIWELDPDTMSAARRLRKRLMKRLKQCMDADEWPGYTTGVEPIALPAYALEE